MGKLAASPFRSLRPRFVRPQYHAEKAVGEKLVMFDVTFDRKRPQRDSFVVTILDSRGAIVRQEKYSREEVDQTSMDLGSMLAVEGEQAKDLAKEARERLERRRAGVVAATQPAGGG